MKTTLDYDDIDVAKKSIELLIAGKTTDIANDTYQKIGGVLEIVLLQIVIPIFVSLTGTFLADALKHKKAIHSLKRKEAEEIIKELCCKPLINKVEMDESCLMEAQKLLAPYGVSEGEIKLIYKNIYEEVMQKLQDCPAQVGNGHDS